MTLTIGRLSHVLEIEETTLRGWVALAESTFELGHRDGGRRVFSFPEAYALGVFAALFHANFRVGPSVVATVLGHIVRDGEIVKPAPGETLEVSESDGAAMMVFLDRASDIVSDRLNSNMVAA